ncbi:MAG: DedA family protein [Ignavibacteriae bacterium]|nr:DedA family protein [Ignavibacteria bacterium]MBI3363280.1 DedA family protein [Ignavibacteriota bacterium]
MELVTLWIAQYGYFGLFALLMLGIAGLPIPDETLLTFCGYLIYRHQFSFPVTLIVAFLGSIFGITLSYILGRSIGLYLLHRYGRYVLVTPEKLERVHQWFERRGKWSLVVGYYIPGVRHLTAYTAGATKLKLPTFMLFAYSGGLIWSTTFILLGYLFGEQWEFVVDKLQENIFVGTLIVAGLLVVLWAFKKKLIRI